MLDVAIIGAGVAGLACARRCSAAGLRVALLDKGRGPGGRLATRRFATPLGEARADHGAQYCTVRGEAFGAALAPLRASGAVQEWRARFEPAGSEPRFVGAPGMNALVRGLAQGLDVSFDARVEALAGGPGAWRLLGPDGAVLAEAASVVCAVPAEQVTPLLATAAPELAAAASAAKTAPCWALMAVFEQPCDPGFDARQCREGALAWLARDSAKPARGGPETWVAHASRDWSQAHLEQGAERVAAALAAELAQHLGAAPAYALAHRWRYAFVTEAAARPCLWDADLRLGACGDWGVGPRIEGAFDSGHALGAAISGAPVS